MSEPENQTTVAPKAAYIHSRWLMRTDRLRRAWTCLALCLAGYVGACAFWRYLASGQWVNFHPGVFYLDLTVPLGEIFRHPLDVLTYPWMILVLGLGLGLLVLVPLILAVLYRPAIATPLVLALILLGHMPVLALAVGVGCALAGRAKFRQETPYLALALGLLPTAGYFAMSAMAGMDASVVLPLQRWVLYAPILIAFISTAALAALLLGLARLAGYRSVAVLPVLTAFLAGPALLFYLEIGADELSYAVIVNQLQPSGSIFDDEALKPWSRRHDAEGLSQQALAERVWEDLRARRDVLDDTCRRFLKRHAASPRRPAILWLRAQAASLQLDEVALAGGLIKCSPTFALQESAQAWQELLKTCPASPQAALAERELAELALRQIAHGADANTQARVADEHLHRAAEALKAMVSSDSGQAAIDKRARREMFFQPAEVPSPDYYRGALEAVEQLAWLMSRNNVLNDPNAAEALGAFVDINPKLPDYAQRIGRLLSDPAKARESTNLGDNIKLAVALQTPNVYERAEMLMALAKDERTDAAIVANFELGKLAMRTAEAPNINQLVKGLKTPEEYFRIVIAAHPENPYHRKAAELLAGLQPAVSGK
jgi:hypothetical protein